MGRGYEQFIDDKSPSIVEIFQRRQPIVSGNQSANLLDVDEVVRRLGPNLQLIPSKFHFSDNLIGAIGTDDRILARLIADNFQDRDLIIIDCPPTESIFTRVAYHASRFILVPVKPEFFATIGFPLLNDSLSEFKRKNPNHDIEVIGIVINDTFDYQADDYTPEKSRALKEIKKEAECSGWYIFENGLEYSRGFPKIMRGDYDWPGDAPRIVSDFAEEFIEIMWDIVEPEFIE